MLYDEEYEIDSILITFNDNSIVLLFRNEIIYFKNYYKSLNEVNNIDTCSLLHQTTNCELVLLNRNTNKNKLDTIKSNIENNNLITSFDVSYKNKHNESYYLANVNDSYIQSFEQTPYLDLDIKLIRKGYLFQNEDLFISKETFNRNYFLQK